MTNKIMDRFVSSTQICEMLQITYPTLRSYVKRGMPYYSLGQTRKVFDVAEVKSWIEKSKIKK